MSTLAERQIELETEMGNMGVASYFKNLAKRGQAENVVGNALLENSLQPLIEKLKEFDESTKSGMARRLATTSRYLEMIGHKEVAYLALRRIINGLSGKERMVSMAEGIATLLEDELNYREFRKESPRLMDAIIRNLKGTAANAQHKKKVIMGAKIKLAKLEKNALPNELKLKVGTKLIELVTELKLCKFVSHIEGKEKTVIYVEATDSLQVWLALQNRTCSLLSPVFLPMIDKPKPWSTMNDGGYHATTLTLMKTRNKKYLSELNEVDMPIVYDSLNALQDTPWLINRGVYNVMKELWDTTGGGIAKMPFREGKPIPMKPIDIDTNPEALAEWKGKASAVHNENFKNRSKIVALSQKLWLAEKFLDEEAIYFPHVMDWRGRAYAVPGFVNPQSDDFGKALLHFAEGKPLGTEGAAWLAIQLANTFGYDKVDFDSRIVWAEENTQAILDSALRPIEGNRFWLLADKPFQFLAACFEWLGYTMQGEEYVSRIAVALDGSCNGLQNFSAMLRDERGGRTTNLVPSSKPSDIYQEVANVVQGFIDAVISTAINANLASTKASEALGSALFSADKASEAEASAVEASNNAASIGFTTTDLQNQTFTSFNTSGTASAYVLTPNPVVSTLLVGTRFNITLHTAPVGSPFITVSSMDSKALKYRDALGNKQFISATQAPIGWNTDIIYDGTDFVVLNIANGSTVNTTVSYRQAIQYGAVSIQGVADLITQAQLGVPLASGVSTNGSFLASVGNGYNTDGSQKNVNLTINSPKNSGVLTASSTNYMWLDTGTGSVGVVTVRDVFQHGGAISSAINTYTYDTLSNTMYLGNGSTAAQVNRLIISEIDTNSTVVTGIRVRPYRNQYDSGFTPSLPETASINSRTHGLGRVPDNIKIIIVCTTADNGYAVGDIISWNTGGGYSGAYICPGIGADRRTIWLTHGGPAPIVIIPKGGNTQVSITSARWSYKLIAGMNPT